MKGRETETPKQAAARRVKQTWEPLCLGQEKRVGVRSEMGGQGDGGGGKSKEGHQKSGQMIYES